MSERTTRRQIESQASRLARELGYRTAIVSAGSVSNGVAWTVTLTTAEHYKDAWRDDNDTTTLSLHRGMSATFDMLHDMAEGASLANLRRGERGAHDFERDDRVELGFILRSRGQSHAGEVLAVVRDALEAGKSVRVVVE